MRIHMIHTPDAWKTDLKKKLIYSWRKAFFSCENYFIFSERMSLQTEIVSTWILKLCRQMDQLEISPVILEMKSLS